MQPVSSNMKKIYQPFQMLDTTDFIGRDDIQGIKGFFFANVSVYIVKLELIDNRGQLKKFLVI